MVPLREERPVDQRLVDELDGRLVSDVHENMLARLPQIEPLNQENLQVGIAVSAAVVLAVVGDGGGDDDADGGSDEHVCTSFTPVPCLSLYAKQCIRTASTRD
eukprot:9371211-Pyramimonas_sp.AAC.1